MEGAEPKGVAGPQESGGQGKELGQTEDSNHKELLCWSAEREREAAEERRTVAEEQRITSEELREHAEDIRLASEGCRSSGWFRAMSCVSSPATLCRRMTG